ncbi:SpdA protein [Streptomyces sp. NPDC001833]|uniref:SpdA protein n=1 Tax=Streptomyces sp. NPDC001833 TaxID=3154658 RepID=UPI003324681E
MPEARRSREQATAFRSVTVIMGTVVGLTFLFGFGNVWALATRLGVPALVAPLVAPAVDLSVLGLLLGIRYLAMEAAPSEQLRPARRLLILSSLMTLALNVTDPLLSGRTGKAAFDAVGPLLLIGWAEVGPGLLQAMSAVGEQDGARLAAAEGLLGQEAVGYEHRQIRSIHDTLLERARREDAEHWKQHRRPISAETLRKRLRIGAARSRTLVATLRNDRREDLGTEP